MIDNLERIYPLLKWESDDQFYFIQLIARKKDIAGMQGNNRVIKDYYVYSAEYLDKVYPEIQKLCKQFEARAYIRLSRRDAADIAKDLIVLVGEAFRNNSFQHLRKIYSTAVGQNLGLDKLWIIDLDGAAISAANRIAEAINVLQPQDITKKVYGRTMIVAYISDTKDVGVLRSIINIIMNKSVVKEIKFILDKLMDDGDDDRLGGASRTLVYNLDKLVWNYHKDKAASLGIQTHKSWFMELARDNPLVQYTRDAIEILVDVASHANNPMIKASTSLCDIYIKAIDKFYDEIAASV